MPYFICGHLIATSKRDGGKLVSLMVFVASVFLTAVGCYFLAHRQGLDRGLYFYGYLSISVIPMSIALMWLLKSLSFSEPVAERLGVVSALTLGIYLVHPVFLSRSGFFISRRKIIIPCYRYRFCRC